MTINVANLDITTDTFGTWVAKTNSLAHIITNHAVTVDSTAFGNNSTGNGTVIGRFGANTIFAIDALRGGDVAAPNTLVISSNLSVANTATVIGAATFSNTINVAGLSTFTTNVAANGITSNNLSIGNVSINTAALTLSGAGVTITAVANSTATRITVGNSTINATHLYSNNGYFSGNLVVDGTFITTSDLSISGDIIPPITNNYDIGNTTNIFKNAYFDFIDATNADISNSITIGTTVVNSTVLQSSSLFTVNTTSNTVGSARFSNTVLVVGSATLSNTLTVTGNATFSNTVSVVGLVNVNTLNVTTANATNLNVSGPAALTNTLNVTGLTTVGSINTTTANATAINVGANVNLTTTSITIGNSSVNTFANSTTLDLDGTLVVAGTTTVTNTINTSGPVNVGSNVVLTTTQIRVGNSSANVTVSNNSINVNGGTVNSTSFSGTANNATNFDGQPSSFYVNASNISTGTLPNARLSSSVVNTSANFTMGGVQTYNANIVLSSTAGIVANGSVGSPGNVLLSNGSSAYWSTGTTVVRQTFTATNNQTSFTVSGGYSPNLLDVFYNGVKLINGTEVIANSGTAVVLATGAANGATIDVVGYTAGSLSVANAVARSGDTMTGPLSLPSNGLTVGTTQLAVSGGNVGIGTGSPGVALDVISSSIRIATSGGNGYGFIRLGQSGTATNNWHYGSEGDGTFRWYNGNFGSGTERMRLDSGGNLTLSTSGVITTTGTEINVGTGQNEQKRLRFQNANRNVFFYLDNTTFALWDTNASANRWTTDASGNFTATGNITAFSDENLKENIETINDALDTVTKLRGVKYKRKDTGEAGIGVIAQEVQQHVPEVVHNNEDSPLSVSYGNMVGLLIEAIKEQQEKITSLENKINSLLGGSV